jgi:hypothetical protein
MTDWKGSEECGCGLVEYYTLEFALGSEENHELQYNLFIGPPSYRAHPNYKSGTLLLESVLGLYKVLRFPFMIFK